MFLFLSTEEAVMCNQYARRSTVAAPAQHRITYITAQALHDVAQAAHVGQPARGCVYTRRHILTYPPFFLTTQSQADIEQTCNVLRRMVRKPERYVNLVVGQLVLGVPRSVFHMPADKPLALVEQAAYWAPIQPNTGEPVPVFMRIDPVPRKAVRASNPPRVRKGADEQFLDELVALCTR